MQDQFTFIHDAILESVTCGDTQISATNLRTAIVKLGKKAGFQHQMKVREKLYRYSTVNVASQPSWSNTTECGCCIN